MMKQEDILSLPHEYFADGEIKRYEARLDDVIVMYAMWNESEVLIRFSEYEALIDSGAVGSEIRGVRGLTRSELIHKTRTRVYEKPPEQVSWTHYQLLDIDEIPILEVVAEACTVEVLSP